MTRDISVDPKVVQSLKLLQKRQLTGELVVTLETESPADMHLYFYLGRLVYAMGEKHRVRRWLRALIRNCPNLRASDWSDGIESVKEPWEPYIVNRTINQGKIGTDRGKAVIRNCIQEVLFALANRPIANMQWNPGKPLSQNLVLLSGEQVTQQISVLREKWQGFGLGNLQNEIAEFSPDLAPVVKSSDGLKAQVLPENYKNLSTYLNGQNTLWDLALKMQEPIEAVTHTLLPLIRNGIVRLKVVPDLALPVRRSVKSSTRGVIACVDDSPFIGQEMASILIPAGYEVFDVRNPHRGLGILLNRKPDLIFLDLVMPNTNGYDLCSALRKTSTFQDAPIVILTAHDGAIERFRAQIAGCTDFLSKPPDAAKVLGVVRKYLEEEAGESRDRANLSRSKD